MKTDPEAATTITASEVRERTEEFHKRSANHISEYLSENERLIKKFRDEMIMAVRSGKFDSCIAERFNVMEGDTQK